MIPFSFLPSPFVLTFLGRPKSDGTPIPSRFSCWAEFHQKVFLHYYYTSVLGTQHSKVYILGVAYSKTQHTLSEACPDRVPIAKHGWRLKFMEKKQGGWTRLHEHERPLLLAGAKTKEKRRPQPTSGANGTWEDCQKWSSGGLNSGPLACKASALPLSYNPDLGGQAGFSRGQGPATSLSARSLTSSSTDSRLILQTCCLAIRVTGRRDQFTIVLPSQCIR
ncbi:MAG: hypothetical protein J3Q66DRAFT_96411 [Benniella sp.]|nr:MAG: hypothetical protein J3Q66DRAFT_96411 [Benniella sp.]